ncbi:unnamed protein product, partial [Laminaria digitata]
QKGKDSVPHRTVVLHRRLPFSTNPASRTHGTRRRSHRHHRHHHRRKSSNTGGNDHTNTATDGHDNDDNGDDDDDDEGAIVRAHPHALQAFRFHCRSGQLFLAEQLAAAGVWDSTGSSDNRSGGSSRGVRANNREGSSHREGTREGLRTAWMAARLKPAMRKELKEKRERVRRALEDVRRLAGSRGTIFLLPRIGIETGGAAATGWDLRAVPSQREVVRALRSFEKWLCRGGVWAAQPALALLTTCGTTAPRGIKAAVGADGVTTAATAATAGEYVAPSDYPTDEVLAEMVDAYEALICWFYTLPGDDNDNNNNNNGGRGGGGGNGGGGGISCFVAYHDEGKRRPSASATTTTTAGHGDPSDKKTDNIIADDDPSHKNKIAELEQKRAAIAARTRDRQQKKEGGDGQDSGGSSATSNSGDDAADDRREDELDALDFEPGALRVRVILGSQGTTELLRKATGVFLSAARNRNPVKRNALSAFALQDLGATLGVANVLKALPPHIQDITIIQHGLLGVVPVHALPLEEASSIREPGRTATAGGLGWRPPSSGVAGGGGGFGSSAAAGASAAAPLVVLDRW